MRIFSGILIAALMAVAGSASAQQASTRANLDAGLAAYRSGHSEIAIPTLTEAAARGDENTKFFAEFYLARMYSESAGGIANHPRAFVLFRKIADENAEVDPAESQRAAFVAKALIALASYTRSGLREIDLPPNPRRATDYLYHAANYFGDKEAQLELAKVYVSGEASKDDVRRGMHYLSTLSEESNPSAQAVLAEMFWRGNHVRRDEQRALALITMAVENAPAHDRIWIEEIYHGVFCGTSQDTRQVAEGFIARWRNFFARPTRPADGVGLVGRDLLPERQCSNGEKVAVRR
jgi:TPR repeat protein